MGYDQQRSYSVLARDELKKKMKKQINDISQIFCLSKSDATVLLMHLGWDSLRVSERLGENKEKLLMESGLISVVIDSNRDLSDSSSEICFEAGDEFDGDNQEFEENDDEFEEEEEDDDDDDSSEEEDSDDDEEDDDDLISTPFCSHEYCVTEWREYLEMNFYSLNENLTTISCPDKNCQAAVGPDTIDKLPVHDQEMYEDYILRSYHEGKVLRTN